MNLAELEALLAALGCPAEKAGEMAAQLQKRAGQLAQLKNTTSDAALEHLLQLMKKGWAAQAASGTSPPDLPQLP